MDLNIEITDIIPMSFYEVYNELGAGFLESVYENVMDIVLTGYGFLEDLLLIMNGKISALICVNLRLNK